MRKTREGFLCYRFDDPVFRVPYIILIGDYPLGPWVHRNWCHGAEISDFVAGQFVELTDNGSLHACVIKLSSADFTNPENVDTLYHECLHATITVLQQRCVLITKENDEVSCYYQTFLARTIRLLTQPKKGKTNGTQRKKQRTKR